MLSALYPITLAAVVSGAPTRNVEFTAPAVAKIKVRNGSGDVEITAGDVSKITVRAKVTGDGVEVDREQGRSTFEVETRCPRARFFNSCNVDYRITVPRQTAVEIKTGSGDIAIDGIQGQARLKAGSGDIRITRVASKDIETKIGSGDIEIDASSVRTLRFHQGSGSFKATDLKVDSMKGRTSSGRLEAQIVGTAPKIIDINTGSGDVRLKVPQTTYKVDVDTGSGEVEMHRIQVDRTSPHAIEIDTGSGDVEIVGGAKS